MTVMASSVGFALLHVLSLKSLSSSGSSLVSVVSITEFIFIVHGVHRKPDPTPDWTSQNNKKHFERAEQWGFPELSLLLQPKTRYHCLVLWDDLAIAGRVTRV